MARTPKDVTDAELAVLEVLWHHGAQPVRDIADELYPGGGNSESATVQKLCERLVAKGCVTRDRRSRPNLFRATVERTELIGRQLKSVADRLCEGSYTPLLNQLVEDADLAPDEVRRLRELVDELDQRKARRKSKASKRKGR